MKKGLLESKVRRYAVGIPLTFALSTGIGAGAIGAAFGDGERFHEKVADAATASVDAVVNHEALFYIATHPLEVAQTGNQAYKALVYAKEHMPSAEEIDVMKKKTGSLGRRLQIGSEQISYGVDILTTPDTYNPFATEGSTVKEGVNSVRSGLRVLPHPDSLSATIDKTAEVVKTASDVIDKLPYKEMYGVASEAVDRLADNFARDEAPQTTALILASLLGAMAVGAAGTYWMRRGQPGIFPEPFSKAKLRRGMERWPTYHADQIEQQPKLMAELERRVLDRYRAAQAQEPTAPQQTYQDTPATPAEHQ